LFSKSLHKMIDYNFLKKIMQSLHIDKLMFN
jgi:hypothetical protein